jgi:hypothetical protein
MRTAATETGTDYYGDQVPLRVISSLGQLVAISQFALIQLFHHCKCPKLGVKQTVYLRMRPFNRCTVSSVLVLLVSLSILLNVLAFAPSRPRAQCLAPSIPISTGSMPFRTHCRTHSQAALPLYSNGPASVDEHRAKTTAIKYGTAALSVGALTAFGSQSPWLHEHADLAMIGIFTLGYLGIIFEEVLEFNKAGVALLMSTGLWITYADFFQNPTGKAMENVVEQLSHQLAEVSDICFFLLAASAIVEVVDGYQGFQVVTNKIRTTSKKELFWTIGFLTFFLSSILNNLTVTIVMVSLLRKLIPDYSDRRLFGAMVVSRCLVCDVFTVHKASFRLTSLNALLIIRLSLPMQEECGPPLEMLLLPCFGSITS